MGIFSQFFEDCDSWETLKEKYDAIKFIIHHLKNDTHAAHVDCLMKMIEEKEISKEAVWSIARHCAVDRNKVFRKLISIG